MNYLAHFHLSYGDDELLLGALLGDFIKGPLRGVYSPGIERGIWLHRKIDAFTDAHPQLKEIHRLFDPSFRRYCPIMLDVIFDHFLNRHWQQFHHLPLTQFNEEIYLLLRQQKFQHAAADAHAERLIRYDVLGSYHDWQTVEVVLQRIGKRLGRENPLPQAAPVLHQNYAVLERLFVSFYPQLIEHSRQLRSHQAPPFSLLNAEQ